MTDTFFPYDQITLNEQTFPKLVFERKESQQKPDPETGKLSDKVTYYSAPLAFNYKNPKNGKMMRAPRMLIQGPKMKSNGGIQLKENNGRMQASMWCSHDMTDEKINNFIGYPVEPDDWIKMPDISTDEEDGRDSIGFMSNLHQMCMDSAYECRGSIGVTGIKNRSAFEAIFKNPYKFRHNPDGTVVPGCNPSKYYNLYLMGDIRKKGHRKAIMSIPANNKDGETVLDWAFLKDADVEFIPLFNFKSVYCGGGKLSLQMEIVSAVITSFVKQDSKGKQVETIQALREDKALLNTLQDQLAEMMKSMDGDSTKSEEKKTDPEPEQKEETEEGEEVVKPKTSKAKLPAKGKIKKPAKIAPKKVEEELE